MEAAARAAGACVRRFSSAYTSPSAAITASAALTASVAHTASVATGRGSDGRQLLPPRNGLPEIHRVSDPSVCSLGMGFFTAQLQGSKLVNQWGRPADSSTPPYMNPRCSRFPLADSAFARSGSSLSSTSAYMNPRSQFPLADAALARGTAFSMGGRRHFSSEHADNSGKVLGPNDKIYKYKQEVIKPTLHEAKSFAKEVLDPMMKFPNDKVRLLADDLGSFYTLAERGKPVFNSFRQILVDLHRSGRAFAKKITMSDFWITESYPESRMEGDNLIQEQTYKFVIKDGTPLCDFSYRAVKDNYCDASDALREFIGFTCDLDATPLAPDLDKSLSYMKITSYPKGYLTYVDPVYLRLEDRSEAFLDIYDLLDAEDMQTRNYSGSARKVVVPNNSSGSVWKAALPNDPWQGIAGSHELLRMWYDFKEEGYYDKKKGSWSLLGYLRHVNRHPFNYFDTRFGVYTKAELQRLLQVKFPWVLPSLYRNMFRLRVLKSSGAHRFFRLH